MDFIFRAKLNKDIALEDIKIDIKNLTISNNYDQQTINENNFDLFFSRKGSKIEDFLFEDNDYLVIINNKIKKYKQD